MAGLTIDLGLFNLLALTPAYSDDPTFPAYAKIITVLASMIFVFFANQSFTFKHVSFDYALKSRFFLFWLSQAVGFVLVISPFLFFRYFLGFNSLLIDNVSGGLIGPAIAFVFRYWFSKRFTFSGNERE